MMKKEYKNVFVIFIVFLFMKSEYVDSSNVLAVIPYNTRSHFIVIEPLLKELAIRGHNVTVVSPFPQKEPLNNYTDIDARHLIPPHSNTFTLDFVRKELGNPVKVCNLIWEMGSDVCEKFYADETFRNLINTSESTNGVKFDLLITEIFGSECFLGLAHKLDIPVVSIVTSVALPWTGDRVGNPDNPSYIANYLTNYGDHMTLYQRVVNTISSQLAKYFSHYFSDIPSHAIAKKYLGDDLPPLEEIARKRTALVMANSYFTVNQPRPFVPNFIEIGGIHLQKPRPLEKKVKDILDNTKDGFIYFSLGSLFKGASMDPHVIESFLKAFSELPQLVLWKFEEELKDTPPNVLISKWWPQREVLVHKNIKAFITHGGLSSTLEAVNAGVPVIGIPMFADQPGNVNNIVRRGAGIQLNYEEINYNSLKDALHKLINDKSYMKNAKEMSARFKDRPLCPLDNAAFWIEYVLRHKGGFHMHSAGTDLPLYQYLLLDVAAIITIALFSLIFIVYKIIKKLYNLIVKINKSDIKQKMKKTQ